MIFIKRIISCALIVCMMCTLGVPATAKGTAVESISAKSLSELIAKAKKADDTNGSGVLASLKSQNKIYLPKCLQGEETAITSITLNDEISEPQIFVYGKVNNITFSFFTYSKKESIEIARKGNADIATNPSIKDITEKTVNGVKITGYVNAPTIPPEFAQYGDFAVTPASTHFFWEEHGEFYRVIFETANTSELWNSCGTYAYTFGNESAVIDFVERFRRLAASIIDLWIT